MVVLCGFGGFDRGLAEQLPRIGVAMLYVGSHPHTAGNCITMPVFSADSPAADRRSHAGLMEREYRSADL